MRVIIAGSRDGVTYDDVRKAMFLASLRDIEPTVVISGTARGADRLGERWAEQHGIPIERHPADWLKYGRKKAGHIRNEQMAEVADALVAVWNGRSTGTQSMIGKARIRGLPTFVYNVNKGTP